MISSPKPAVGAPLSNSRPSGAATVRAWALVGFLCLFYILSYIDRIILSLLADPLQKDLGVNDVQLGLLFGSAFAFFYGIAGIPLARLVDKGNRKYLLVMGVMLWSLSTVFSAYASTFLTLVIFRVGLAIGEAVLSPSAYSMIADSFPPDKRAFPAAIYASSGTFGAYGSYIIGAAIISALGSPAIQAWTTQMQIATWRIVFIVVGVPGIFLALLFWLFMREPERTPLKPGEPETPTFLATLNQLKRRWKLYLGLIAGAGGVNIISFAYAGWTPEILRREFEFSISQAGIAFGLVGLCASIPGTLGMTWIATRLKHAGRKDAIIVTAAGAAFLGGSAAMLAPLAPTVELFLGALFLAVLFLTGCTNLAFVSSQTLAPPEGRATFVALLLMGTTMIGLGIGPPAAAFVAGTLFGGAFMPALVLISCLVTLIATALILNGRKEAIALSEEQGLWK